MSFQTYDFQHFLDAQEQMYTKALQELQSGKKENHWMWFIFPQLRKPHMSDLSKKFALSSKEEAHAYLHHDILGPRLIACTQAVLSNSDKTLTEIFGTEHDAKKFIGCMHLFKHVDETGLFERVLGRYV